MEDRLDELISKYWLGTLSSSELEELEHLLLSYPEEWLKMGLLHKTKIELKPMLSKKEPAEIADRILRKKNDTNIFSRFGKKSETRNRSSFFKKYKYGWILLLVGAGTLFFLSKMEWTSNRQKMTGWEQVITLNGMKTNLRLKDGTEVWLNAGSTLKYPEAFQEGVREVYLTGEAYFKVRHEADAPFIVHTAKMHAKVLGTELDIRAYPDEAFSEAALISGAVKVIFKEGDSNKSIRLKPHQKIVIRDQPDQKSHETELKPLSGRHADSLPQRIQRDIILEPIKLINEKISLETAWKQNVLIYEDEPFDVLARRLDRWYGIHIIIKDSALAKQRFTGRADNVSLEKLLHILKMLKPFTYVVDGDRVIIK